VAESLTGSPEEKVRGPKGERRVRPASREALNASRKWRMWVPGRAGAGAAVTEERGPKGRRARRRVEMGAVEGHRA
jgi:hypothetical protein